MNDLKNANEISEKISSFFKRIRLALNRSLIWKVLFFHFIFISAIVIYFDQNKDLLSRSELIASLTLMSFLVSLKMYLMFTKDIGIMKRYAESMHAEQVNNKLYTQMPEEFSEFVSASNKLVRALKLKLKNVRSEHHQLDVILSSMVDGVIALDKNQQVLLINDTARRLFQIQDEDLIGQKLWKKIRYPQVNQIIDDVFDSKNYQRGQFTLAHEKGEIVAELLGSSIVDEHNKFLGAVLVIQDVSSKKQFEKIRRDFVANASHDLKTPIAAINAMVETMQDDPDMSPDNRQRFIGKIQRQTQRLHTLVQQLMNLSKAEAIDVVEKDNKKLFDLCELAEQLADDLTPLLEKKSLTLDFQRPQEKILINAEREAIEQVLQNLLDNAIKYTHHGSIKLAVYQEENNSVVSVQDTGEGISESERARIFERFYRADKSRTSKIEKPAGSGIGLAIVKHVIEKHSGEIFVTSELGVGSTFKIVLPL